MPQPFLDSNPTPDQLRALIKYLSTYRDGSGNIREKDPGATTRADSRQIERCFAELFGVKPPESKSYYDFVVEVNKGGGIVVSAASIKSKEQQNLREYKQPALRRKLRAYLEVANASAKDWAMCHSLGLTTQDFQQHRYPDTFGQAIMQRQIVERAMAETKLQKLRKHHSVKTVDAAASVFLSIMYSPMDSQYQRDYLVSSYPIILPEPVRWEFRSKALVGIDEQGEVLYEWYALSGSQFKYYPLISSRIYGSDLFQLLVPAQQSLHQRAVELFGHS